MSDRLGRLLAGLAALSMLGTAAEAQEKPPTPPMGPGVIGAPGGTGPLPAVAVVEPNLNDHVVYRPNRLPAARLPILLWGNGACRDNGLAYARFLRQIASHGYVVVAVGHARSEEPMRPALAPTTTPVLAAGRPGAEGPARGADETEASQLLGGLDWAIAENQRSGSPYYHRLDTSRVAVAGHSCGGLQAIAVAADPRVRTALIMNSGIYNRGAASGRSGILLTKDALRRFHGPVAYINGGPADIAYANALDDFEQIERVPAFFGWLPVAHGGTYFTEPNGGRYADIATAWLDWQLKGDRKAGRMFSGPDCGLCRNSPWTIRRKRL